MSLFQAREWWHTVAGSQEEYDVGSLLLSNIDNDPKGDDKIITGSLQGLLRIYHPRQKGFKINDLMLEEFLHEPILQLTSGRFVRSMEREIALAVLHPRTLSVYEVTSVGGFGEKSMCLQLSKSYQHALGDKGEHFTAYNMVSGPFGGVQDRDLILVQSVDGKIQAFEQEAHAFTRILRSTILPGPICYLPTTDAFVTTNSKFQVVCYKYYAMATLASESVSSSKGKQIGTEWDATIGEDARFLGVIDEECNDVVVIGDRTLFVLGTNGSMRYQLHLDISPSALCRYRIPKTTGDVYEEGPKWADGLIVGTFERQLRVYKDRVLSWAATTLHTPVAVTIGRFGGHEGLIVTLSENGHLTVSYLGTDPPKYTTSSEESKRPDFRDIEEEYHDLMQQIKLYASAPVHGKKEGGLTLTIRCPDRIDVEEDDSAMLGRSPANLEDIGRRISLMKLGSTLGIVRVTVKILLHYGGMGEIGDVVLSVKTPKFIATSESSIEIGKIGGNGTTPLIAPITFIATKSYVPTSLTVTVTATYSDEQGHPGAVKTEFRLPFGMACTPTAPDKKGIYKLTLHTDQPPVSVLTLFDEMVQHPGCPDDYRHSASSHLMTFKYWYEQEDGPLLASVLVSKNAGRYRIQSDTMYGLWLTTQEIVLRIGAYFHGSRNDDSERKQEAVKIRYEDDLPLQDCFSIIDSHFELRQQLEAKNAVLEKCTHQFRVVQKRLLVRYKEKNPAPLGELVTIFDETYDRLIRLADEIQELQKHLEIAANRLSCAMHLTALLIRYRFSLDEKNYEYLKSCLYVDTAEDIKEGWEECVDTSLTYFLKTTLGKTTKEHTTMPQTIPPLTDTSRLKKHISLMCDRLHKGSRLIVNPSRKDDQ